MSELKQRFEEELKQTQHDALLSPEFRRKKLLFYVIRTLIAIVLFYVLWDYKWTKWVLYAYIPLNLLSLLSILLWPYIIRKKTERTRQKIEEMEALLDQEEE